MKIAIVTDKQRSGLLTGEEGRHEDRQKRETVLNIKEVLSKRFECIDLIADDNIIARLREERVDMVFNLCNGIKGDCKLAQLPAMLEFAGIPYTGSSVMGHALSLNKGYACRVFQSMGIPTPNFISVYSVDELKTKNIQFPVLVKPSDEGSGRGIHQDSLVCDMDSLIKKVDRELNTYNPPVMVTDFIDGREFTVGVIGNGDEVEVLPIMEIGFDNLPQDMARFYSFEVKTYYGEKTTYTCPADIDNVLKERIEQTAILAYRTLSIRDYARIDMRVKDGVPYVLEINSLPGLWKGYSDLPKMAESSGLGYEGLIMKIVESALKRL